MFHSAGFTSFSFIFWLVEPGQFPKLVQEKMVGLLELLDLEIVSLEKITEFTWFLHTMKTHLGSLKTLFKVN